MSNLVSPRTISLYSKQPSLRDETKSAKSEISLAPKSPTKKLLLIGSREIDSVNLSPKKIAATPIVWPSQPQQLNDKSVASSLNTNRESEAGPLKKAQFGRKMKGKLTAGDDRKESAPQILQTLNLNKKSVDDYSSLLMCFPERIESLSIDKKSPRDFFNPFSDLVKSTMNKHDGRLLEDILEEDLIIRSAREGGDRNVDKRDLMKKVLEFNKIQKYHYLKQTAAEKKNILLPLIKQVKEKNKHIPPVKVLPSRRLWEDNAPVEIVAENKNTTTTVQSPQQANLTTKKPSNSSSSANVLALNTSASQTTVSHSKKVSQNLKAYEEKIDIGIPLYAFKAMRVFWGYNSSNDTTWKPETREGHTFTTVGKQIVLYGGLSAALLEEVTIYDPVKALWEKPRVTGDIPLSGRHGHTACEYKKALIIFGGEHQFNPTLSIRECLNDTRMFIPEKNEWKHMRTHNQINPRRHHAAATHDHLMWVYGGINNEGKFMKDMWALNLRNFTWEKVEAPGDRESGLAFHSLSACYVDRSSYANKEKRTYEEGLYVFGGKNSEGKILGTLKVCSAEGKVYQWSYPITKGNPPTPRYNHTTLFYEPLGLLVVYGGRNDSLYESMNDICLNDIRILNLEQMVWIQTTSYGDVPKVGRYRHGAAAFGTKMLIFGGVEFQRYANEEVKSVEIHQSKVKNIIHMDADAEASGDRTKSRNESLPPILKDSKRNKKDHILIAQGSLQQPRQILSYLPIPIQRSFGDDEDVGPRSVSNLSPLPMDRSGENMSRTGL